MDEFDSISPLDFRYADDKMRDILSERAFIAWKLKVECALVTVLHGRSMCSKAIMDEIHAAAKLVTVEEVAEEEGRTRHDVRALVNCLQSRVSDEARPFVHLSATSYDIVDTANALRYRAAVEDLLLPAMLKLETELIKLTEREAGTIQIGRTHGQHGVPITFGFATASYVDRLGWCIEHLRPLAKQLVGKFSGAVGAYNASSLFFSDPEVFEVSVLAELCIPPAGHATQIVPPEPVSRLMSEIIRAMNVVGNLARDMRHLQRTEIAEVAEAFGKDQVGSSTMAHKANPISWENLEGVARMMSVRLMTVYLDMISEHQRDLTASISTRTYVEIIAYAIYAMDRAASTVSKLRVNADAMKKNLALTQGMILAEPLYLLLAAHGHPDAHELSRTLSMKARQDGKPLMEIALADDVFRQYYDTKFTDDQRRTLTDPCSYLGHSKERALKVTSDWKMRLNITV